MDIKALRKKLDGLVSDAEAKLAEVNEAIEADEFDRVDELNEEYDALQKKIETVKGTLERAEKAEEDRKSASRLPFDTTDEPDDEPGAEEDSFAKAIYRVRYGEINDAAKAVARDIWGNDYNEKRANQHRAFVKYVRLGESRMNANERKLLDELIYTPDVILREVKAGYNVDDIRSNKVDQQENVLQLGGALVPEDVRMDIIQRLEGPNTVRAGATVINTARDSVEFPKLEGGDSHDDRYISGVRVTWADAEIPADATFAQTNFELGTIKIPVHVVMARTDLSLNLLEDSGVDIVGFIGEQFASAQRVDENEQFLVGRGGGRPRGILANGTATEPSPEDGITSVVSGQASALTADGLIDLVYELPTQYAAGAELIGTRKTFREVRQLKDGQGDYLWARGIERGAPPTVLGYDWMIDEAVPEVAANAYPVIFGNLMGYYIVERVGMTIERVRDTTTVGRNKAAIFMRRRLGGQVVLPWMFKVQQVAAS